MDEFVLYDDKGVIEQGPEDDVAEAFEATTDFTGDLVMAKVVARRR